MKSLKIYFKTSMLCILSLLLTFTLSGTTYAASPSGLSRQTLNSYGINGIYYYNPSGNVCTTIATGIYDGNATAGSTPSQAAFMDTYHDLAEQLSVQFGVPWELALAQGIKESAAGTSPMARSKNNFHGIHAPSNNPEAAWSYSSPENGWIGYFHNLATTAVYRSRGLFSGDTITNPAAAIRVIGTAYAEDGSYTESVISSYLPMVRQRAQEKGWKSTSELAQENPVIYQNAARIANGGTLPYTRSSNQPWSFTATGASGNNGDTGGQISSNFTNNICTTAVGQGNGNIAATALNLARPTQLNKNDPDNLVPTNNYRQALQQLGLWTGNGTCEGVGNSCSIFVAAVMKFSGVDTSFPATSAAGEISYMASHPELYQEIPNTGDTSNLQPGDIIGTVYRNNPNASGHIMIYVRKPDGSGYGVAAASQCEYTAQIRNYYPRDNYGTAQRIFRFIGAN